MPPYIATAEITRLRELAAAGNHYAQLAAASYERMQGSPRNSKMRSHHRRAFRRHAARALFEAEEAARRASASARRRQS